MHVTETDSDRTNDFVIFRVPKTGLININDKQKGAHNRILWRYFYIVSLSRVVSA